MFIGFAKRTTAGPDLFVRSGNKLCYEMMTVLGKDLKLVMEKYSFSEIDDRLVCFIELKKEEFGPKTADHWDEADSIPQDKTLLKSWF